MSNKILKTEVKQLSNEITLIWHWFDRSDQLPGYIFGTDPNPPICCTYQNGQLVATVSWSQEVELKTVLRFLETNPNYIRMPGKHRCPCEKI